MHQLTSGLLESSTGVIQSIHRNSFAHTCIRFTLQEIQTVAHVAVKSVSRQHQT